MHRIKNTSTSELQQMLSKMDEASEAVQGTLGYNLRYTRIYQELKDRGTDHYATATEKQL